MAKSIASAFWRMIRPSQCSPRDKLSSMDCARADFIVGGNIIIERRFAEARPDLYAKFVAELIRLDVHVLVTSAEQATLAAKRATTKIPIVMMNVSDPVGQGIVASLAHPGGNITGVIQDDSPEIAAKRMQFLKDAIPHAAKVSVLTDTDV